MELKRFIENFDSMTIKDITNNYDGLKKNLTSVYEKAKNINDKYSLGSGSIEVEKMPDFIRDINELLKMFQ